MCATIVDYWFRAYYCNCLLAPGTVFAIVCVPGTVLPTVMPTVLAIALPTVGLTVLPTVYTACCCDFFVQGGRNGRVERCLHAHVSGEGLGRQRGPRRWQEFH